VAQRTDRPDRIRVLVVADDAGIRDEFAAAIARDKRLDFVGAAQHGPRALMLARGSAASAAIVVLSTAGSWEREIITDLVEIGIGRVVVVSSTGGVTVAGVGLVDGAHGFLRIAAGGDGIVAAVDRLAGDYRSDQAC
jgi:DNA-binding NarL/FixJ family response regulator